MRDLPYAPDGAHGAATLVVEGRGDCLAKAELLHSAFVSLRLRARLVRFPYLLPGVVPEVDLLPSRVNLHRTVQTWMHDRWLLVDATHHPELRGHLTVAEWDGKNSTAPASEPLGPLLVEGVDDDAIAAAVTAIATGLAACPTQELERWKSAYMDWLAIPRNLP